MTNEAIIQFYTYMDSGLGRILLVSDGDNLTGVYFTGQKYCQDIEPMWQEKQNLPVLKDTTSQLAEYFLGQRTQFDIPYVFNQGTKFQHKVWNAVKNIPYGQTVSYKYIAKAVDNLKGVRAVGAAIGKNPITIIVPCHRVVGSNGAITGYASGIERKRILLSLEA